MSPFPGFLRFGIPAVLALSACDGGSPQPDRLVTRGPLFFSDDFRIAYPKRPGHPIEGGWKAHSVYGKWTPLDGNRFLSENIPEQDHQPLIAYRAIDWTFKNVIIRCEFRFLEHTGTEFFRIAIDSRDAYKGHVCQALLSAPAGGRPAILSIDQHRVNTPHDPAARAELELPDFNGDDWHTLTLELVDHTARARIDDSTLVHRYDGFNIPKTQFSITVGTTPHEVRGLRVWEAVEGVP